MIYMDYSATTPVDKRVLKYFCECCNDYVGNPNSLHLLGIKSKKAIDCAINNIRKTLGINDQYEIVFTSGSSESNNLAIKGLINKNEGKGNHIITTAMEHSSIITTLSYLQKRGYVIDFVKLKKDGTVDLDDLKKIICDDTILITIGSVNSETGIKQPIKEINKIVNKHKNCVFHSDMTQSIGKEIININCVDMASLSAHKFFGLKGIGALIKRKDIKIEPIIHGGKSTTNSRAGTPPLPLILSLDKALEIAYENIEKKYQYVSIMNKAIRVALKNMKNIVINSKEEGIPHILNISIKNHDNLETLNYLADNQIFISNHTACSSDASKSMTIFTLTNDDLLARTSVRISLSHLTTRREVLKLIEKLISWGGE